MITETINIQCDKCGIVKTQQTMVAYRISGQTQVFIKVLENHGWKFLRDDDHELVRIMCDHCVQNWATNREPEEVKE